MWADTTHSKHDSCVIHVRVCVMLMNLFYLEGHDEVNITIEIKPDNTPEVAEVFTVNLVNVSDLDRLQIGAVSLSIFWLVLPYLFYYKLILALSRNPKPVALRICQILMTNSRGPIFKLESRPHAHRSMCDEQILLKYKMLRLFCVFHISCFLCVLFCSVC